MNHGPETEREHVEAANRHIASAEERIAALRLRILNALAEQKRKARPR